MVMISMAKPITRAKEATPKREPYTTPNMGSMPPPDKPTITTPAMNSEADGAPCSSIMAAAINAAAIQYINR